MLKLVGDGCYRSFNRKNSVGIFIRGFSYAFVVVFVVSEVTSRCPKIITEFISKIKKAL